MEAKPEVYIITREARKDVGLRFMDATGASSFVGKENKKEN